MIQLGKAIESFGRKIRPYVSPAHRKAYRSLIARGLSARHPEEPVVCFDLTNQSIDAVAGRYYFSLVRDTIDAGYFPVFVAHRRTLSSFGTRGMKSLLLPERLGVIRNFAELRGPFHLVTDRNAPTPRGAAKVIHVDYGHRRCSQPEEVAFPLFVHPKLTVAARIPPEYDVNATRHARLFFGGNTVEKSYSRNILRETYGMLNRREMLEITAAAMPPDQIHRPQPDGDWLDSTEFHPFVLCESPFKIPQHRWLEALAKADFFLACPGAHMPLCHNLIESMAAGTIPILQYAAHIHPALQNGVNCLTFEDEHSLRTVISRTLTMEQHEIAAMRENVRLHFETHLASGRFASRLFQSDHERQILLLNEYRVPR